MAEGQMDQEDSDKDAFYRFVKIILNDAELSKRVRNDLGVKTGNFWLLCHDLEQKALDPRLWNEPEYWQDFLNDPNSRFRGGGWKDRDRWYDYAGIEHAPFRNWVHKEKLKDRTDEERKKPLTKEEIEEFHNEWDQLSDGKKALYQIETPID